MSLPPPFKKTLTAASRQEYIDLPLQVIMGELPQDIYGAVYFSSPVGTVESDGLPYQKGHQEEGSPVFNGDGMILKIDFSSQGNAKISAQILRTPCYYADETVSTVDKGHEYYPIGFFNMGITRLSFKFGVRNQLNTAILPIRFPGEQVDRLLATFDTGRPYEFDPQSLKLYHPLGKNADWKTQYFPFREYVFPMIASTAHPSYDTQSGEFFSINFTKSILNLMSPPKAAIKKDHAETFFQYLIRRVSEFVFFWQGGQKLENPQIQQPQAAKFEGKLNKEAGKEKKINLKEWSLKKNVVFVVKRGMDGQLHSWRVIGPKGNDIRIAESMHQTGITEDYFVFIDSSFKISMDLLIPYFQQPWDLISKFLRSFFRGKLKGYTNVYIVKRSELTEDSDTVNAACLQVNQEETVHFAINFSNPNQTITIHTAHNSSLCAAEWVRNYDRLAVNPGQLVDDQAVGLPTIGEMDVSKIGKLQFKIGSDQKGRIEVQQHFLETICEPLKMQELEVTESDFQHLGPNTWGIGLHTFYQHLAPDTNVKQIPYIFWQMYGLDYQVLPYYIYKLYKRKSNTVKPKDVLKLTENGIPFSLIRQNTSTMTLEDHFYFQHDQYLRSIQFVPKQVLLEGQPKELQGYIVCTVIEQKDPNDQHSYDREIWIFNAAQLSTGPVCKLTHSDLSFSFTIHSAWLPKPQSTKPAWLYDLQVDYDEVLQTFKDNKAADYIRTFMEDHVYPKVESCAQL